ncbi:MAG: radical SAM protein [Candidatus Odinarchaeia archaeon]
MNEDGNFTWENVSMPISLENARKIWRIQNNSTLENLFNFTRKLSDKLFGKKIFIFQLGKNFPSLSVTGNFCELNCKHCNKRYLEHMIPVKTPKALLETVIKLSKEGGSGFLISGGCDKNGVVPLANYLSALKVAKKNTGLIINAHPGLISEQDAYMLKDAGIDIVSVDVAGENEVIQNIYNLKDKKIGDYERALNALNRANISVAPHICVGIKRGQLSGEINALELIRRTLKPKVIVLIVFIPTKGTPLSDSLPPNPLDVGKVVAIARLMFPKVPISLGCMRPGKKLRAEFDRISLKAGVNGIVNPVSAVIKEYEEKGYEIVNKTNCCVIY